MVAAEVLQGLTRESGRVERYPAQGEILGPRGRFQNFCTAWPHRSPLDTCCGLAQQKRQARAAKRPPYRLWDPDPQGREAVDFVMMPPFSRYTRSAKNKARPSSRREFIAENTFSKAFGFRTSSGRRSRHRGVSESGCRDLGASRVAPNAYVCSSAAGSRGRGPDRPQDCRSLAVPRLFNSEVCFS
jgi:hypothetical protein